MRKFSQWQPAVGIWAIVIGFGSSLAWSAEDLDVDSSHGQVEALSADDDAQDLVASAQELTEAADPEFVRMTSEAEVSSKGTNVVPLRRFAWEVGFNTLGSHMGLSLGFRTPFIWGEWVSLRLLGAVNWFSGFPKESVDTAQRLEIWNSMFNLRTSVSIGHRITPASPFFLYGYGGIFTGIPSASLTDSGVFSGFTGGLGLEVFLQHSAGISLFSDVGAVVSASRANRYDGNPALAGGFLALVGFRCPF